jgi:chromatin modification-related protein VID21
VAIKANLESDAQDGTRVKEAEESHVEAAPNSVEAASSPSSTAGAYSTSTPKPAPPSPDTSPEAAPSPVQHPDLVDETSPSVATAAEASVAGSSGSKKFLPNNNTSDASPEAQLRLEEAQANEAASRSSNKPTVGKESQSDLETQVTTDQSMSDSPVAKDQSHQASTKLPNIRPGKLDQSTVVEVDEDEDEDEDDEEEDGDKNDTTDDDDEDDEEEEDDDVEMADATPKKSSGTQPSKPEHPHAPIDSTPSRMTTRVASGAIRQKSVSEILGEVPKTSPRFLQSPVDIKEQRVNDRHDPARKSTVVFSKDKGLTSQTLRSELDGYLALKGASLDPEKDYLRPLFLFQAWQPPRGQTLAELIQHTRKAITTSDITSSVRESIDYRILRRIYQLQSANKWSLRQPTKYPDPAPVQSHWDLMLDEMKWMRTDFREERKWKMTVARNLAHWCAAYHDASDEEKASLRVKTTPHQTNKVIADSFDEPPELISAGTSEASEDDLPLALAAQTPPHTLFSLGFDHVVFKIDDTPAAHALIGELPFYDPKTQHQPNDTAIPVPPNDNILPVSKFITGKIVPKFIGAPKKRSRYDYEQSDEEYGPSHKRARSDSSAPFLSPARRSSPKTEIPPEDQEVALFNPVNKHILTRIRATNSFRPPSEFQMPSQSFYENRFQSKWTWEEDQRLRHCVRQYQYNWSLIAQDLQTRCQASQFVSGADRRTQWECFERWTQLEGLPADLNRSLYFKAYSQRIEAAIRAVQEKPPAAIQSVGGIRVRGLPPDKISQRRDSRHISMIDAMRRLARRRENTIHRQQEGKEFLISDTF